MPKRNLIVLLAVLAAFPTESPTRVWADEASDLAFFESRIRPVLVNHCYECHSQEAKEIKGSLLLDSAAGVLQGGDSGPSVVAGQPDKSPLIEALRYEGFEMPPSAKLPDNVVRDFEQWVRLGAPDARNGSPGPAPTNSNSRIDVQAGKTFWAFQPVRDHDPPIAANMDWPKSDIDVFVLHRLEQEGLLPAADADARTLVRRIYFDLIGLPPTPEQVREFLHDTSSTALEKLVDRLLDSPQFGVHWGRHWLDVARYADSNGNDFNATFHNAWRYRDYVIDSFNRDKPFDQFVREQVAGDLLPFRSDVQRAEQLIATGFLMIGAKMLSERDKEKLTMDVVDEQINTVGQAFLGLTLGCARCHDHKFDPIPATDYYAMAGIFRSTTTLEGESQQYVSTWPRRELPTTEEHVAAVRQAEAKKKDLQTAIQKAKGRKDALTDEADRKLAAIDSELEQLEEELKQLEAGAPPPLPKAIAVADSKEIGDCEVCIRGEHRNRGPKVPRGFVQVAMAEPAPKFDGGESGRRELADWIASPRNPLTARVVVNRIWHHLIGQGLVRSVDNFGQLGDRPSHPEMLDTLASDFMRDGWSIKQTVRRIVLSRVYRISGAHDEASWQADPQNRLLWRANRKRLSAEAIRDAMLAVSQRLDLSPAGSPVEGLGTLVTTNASEQTPYEKRESMRRSTYLPIIRGELPAMLVAFDFADPDLVVGRRTVTNVPAQSLLLMNSPFVMDRAEEAASWLHDEAATSDCDLAHRAYELVLSRQPTSQEFERAAEFLASARKELERSDREEDPMSPLAQLVHTLFAATEFRMLN